MESIQVGPQRSTAIRLKAEATVHQTQDDQRGVQEIGPLLICHGAMGPWYIYRIHPKKSIIEMHNYVHMWYYTEKG